VPLRSLAPDGWVPVTVWRRGALLTVLFIVRDPDDEEEPYSRNIDVFEKAGDAWRSRSPGRLRLAGRLR
jgi:hypothetical protein